MMHKVTEGPTWESRLRSSSSTWKRSASSCFCASASSWSRAALAAFRCRISCHARCALFSRYHQPGCGLEHTNVCSASITGLKLSDNRHA